MSCRQSHVPPSRRAGRARTRRNDTDATAEHTGKSTKTKFMMDPLVKLMSHPSTTDTPATNGGFSQFRLDGFVHCDPQSGHRFRTAPTMAAAAAEQNTNAPMQIEFQIKKPQDEVENPGEITLYQPFSSPTSGSAVGVEGEDELEPRDGEEDGGERCLTGVPLPFSSHHPSEYGTSEASESDSFSSSSAEATSSPSPPPTDAPFAWYAWDGHVQWDAHTQLMYPQYLGAHFGYTWNY